MFVDSTSFLAAAGPLGAPSLAPASQCCRTFEIKYMQPVWFFPNPDIKQFKNETKMQHNLNLNSAWPDTSFACCRTCKACKPHTRRPTGGPLEFLCATSQVGTPVENWGKFSRMCVRYSAGLLGRNCPLDWTVENFETHHSAIQAIKALLLLLMLR